MNRSYEIVRNTHELCLKYKPTREEMEALKEYFRTCDLEVFTLPTDTAIRRAWTAIHSKEA